MANWKMTFRCGLLMTLICTSGMAAQLPSKVSLQPFGKWQADYGIEECRVIRSFGDPKNPTTFQMEKYDPDNDAAPSLSIASSDLKKISRPIKVSISVDNQNIPNVADGIIISTGADGPNILYIQEAAAFDRMLNADIENNRQTIAHFDSGNTHLTISLGNMAGPLKALSSCMDDLMRSWGFDPKQQHSLQKKPEPITSPATWFSPQDYPQSLSINSKTGGVFVRLNVSETGDITQCHVMKSGGDEQFKNITCDVARKKGRFRPAISNEGKAVASYAQIRVLWRLP